MRSSAFRPDLFSDRHVFVTGGTQGIGLEIARRFGEHGARVTVASRKAEHLEEARRELQSLGPRLGVESLDVRDRAAVEALAQRIGDGVDVLVNNAAGNFPAGFLDMSENAWDAVVNIVLQGTANVCRSFGRRWAANRRPRSVINIVAGYAWTGAPGTSHSGAAKAAVLNLTRSLAVEWAPLGVRANAVAPGPIADTGGARIFSLDERLKGQILKRVPMARLGSRRELADVCLFLASDAAAFVNGACVVVDGGLDARGAAHLLAE